MARRDGKNWDGGEEAEQGLLGQGSLGRNHHRALPAHLFIGSAGDEREPLQEWLVVRVVWGTAAEAPKLG